MVMSLDNPYGLGQPCQSCSCSSPQSPAREGSREDMAIGRPEWLRVSGQWVFFPASEKGLESLFLGLRGY